MKKIILLISVMLIVTAKAFAQGSLASPVDKTVDIVAGKYPILILCADADEAVPPEENASLFEQKVKR